MTRVCLLGDDDVTLPADLLAYETAREALSSYSIESPYANTAAVETISIGAAVSLLNDLNWYLLRLIAASFVFEPSLSETEWLSRKLATAIRNDEIDPAETGEFLSIYGITETDSGTPRLTEPLQARRIGGSTPAYDLHDVDDTLIVRITPEEFGQ